MEKEKDVNRCRGCPVIRKMVSGVLFCPYLSCVRDLFEAKPKLEGPMKVGTNLDK